MKPLELCLAAGWKPDARPFIPLTSSVRKLNALAKRAASLTLERTLETKVAALFPELREQLEDAPRSFSLGVLWTNDLEIQELNRDYRSKDQSTDVLSFPFWEGETLFEGAPVPLGDLVLSLETAARQASELHHSLEREIAFLTVHSTLHLLGFDHNTDAKRRAMFSWQDELVARLSVA